ncbi:MAG: FecR domain-containing protein [Bacteroidota bacterium]
MDYKEFLLEDFLADEFFVNWVKKPNTASDHFWYKWINTYPKKAEIVKEARKIILSTSYQHQHQPTEEDYLHVLEKIHQRKYSKLHKLKVPKKQFHIWRFAAAIIVLIAAVAAFYFNSTNIFKRGTVTAETPKLQEIIRTVPNGQKLQIKLPDGSQVKINSGSKFWYSKDYNQNDREVYLEGEAFFEVIPDPFRPFKVHAGGIVTEVLGTSFNVKAYEKDAIVKVAVAEGKVSVFDNEKNHVLPIILPGNMAVFDIQSGRLGQKQADLEKELAWEKNIIFLEKANFNEVLYELEKWYGITFIVSPDVSISGRFNAKFKDASLNDVLTGLDFSSKINFRQEQDTVWCYQNDLPMR